MIPPIRQELDVRRLDILTEDARDAAEEAGELDGNQHYVDFSAAIWDDVAFALEAEKQILQQLEACANPADLLERFDETRDLEDERGALWHLEVGIAAPVMALNALGAHTTLSCNGGEFGGSHAREFPSIRFYVQAASASALLQLARDSGVGLIEEEGLAILYAASVRDLQRFATLALARYGHTAT